MLAASETVVSNGTSGPAVLVLALSAMALATNPTVPTKSREALSGKFVVSSNPHTPAVMNYRSAIPVSDDATVGRLRSFADLQFDYDGEGGEPATRECVDIALAVLDQLNRRGIGCRVGLSGDGVVFLYPEGVRGEITVDPENDVVVLLDDLNGRDFEIEYAGGAGPDIPEELASVLDELMLTQQVLVSTKDDVRAAA